MAFEIELKAHVEQDNVENVKSLIEKLPSVIYQGYTDKFDLYWSTDRESEPLFRTRKEVSDKGTVVLFTAKPQKAKTEEGTEKNLELEFCAPEDQWNRVLAFCEGSGLKVCKVKSKKGYGYLSVIDGFDIHIELLEVKYLGWFIEMEICPTTLDGFDVDAADKALRKVLSFVNISEEAVEIAGYNRMLTAIGCEKG